MAITVLRIGWYSASFLMSTSQNAKHTLYSHILELCIRTISIYSRALYT
jgi:hypothetical protein